MIVTIIIAVLGASALLAAGYILGAKQGVFLRDALRERLQNLEVNKSEFPLDKTDKKVTDFAEARLAKLSEVKGAGQRFEPSVNDLNVTPFEDSFDLQSLAMHRGDLAHLMRESAEQYGFKTIVLCDEHGFPLASSPNYHDLGRLAAISGFVVIFGERIRREDDFMPVSLMFNDNKQHVVVSRIFGVANQRLILTAVALDESLGLNSLDAIIPKVLHLLKPEKLGAEG